MANEESGISWGKILSGAVVAGGAALLLSAVMGGMGGGQLEVDTSKIQQAWANNTLSADQFQAIDQSMRTIGEKSFVPGSLYEGVKDFLVTPKVDTGAGITSSFNDIGNYLNDAVTKFGRPDNPMTAKHAAMIGTVALGGGLASYMHSAQKEEDVREERAAQEVVGANTQLLAMQRETKLLNTLQQARLSTFAPEHFGGAGRTPT